jgi:hypothetical protein
MPSGRDVKSGTVNALCHMIMWQMANGNASIQLFNPGNCSNIAGGRTLALKMAIKNGNTHVLMIDDDMSFPCQTLETLLSHDKDIVLCNYITKNQYHPRWLANDDNGGIDSSVASEPLQEIRGGGMGMCLIKVDAIKDIPMPWFEFRMKADGTWLAEDFHFFLKCREHGIKVWCDNDLSKDIYHIGDFFYSGCKTMPPISEEI